jgi:predicted O-methyltransferase YrrM
MASAQLLRKVEGVKMRMELRKAGVPNAWRISSFTSRGELIALYKLAKSCPENALVIEIGSYLGKSSCYLVAGLKGKHGHLICVDTWENETMPEGNRDTFEEFKRNTQGASERITCLRKRSGELRIDDVPRKAALIFIDGDHSYEAVRRDVEVADSLLTDDGIVAFHDSTMFEGVSAVIGEMLVNRRWMLAGIHESLCWMTRARFAPKPWLS